MCYTSLSFTLDNSPVRQGSLTQLIPELICFSLQSASQAKFKDGFPTVDVMCLDTSTLHPYGLPVLILNLAWQTTYICHLLVYD